MTEASSGRGEAHRAEVVVVGSVNRDYVCRVDRLPLPGQTLIGGEASVGSGGKGGNQAVAASLVGARTALVAGVGNDDDGRALLADLRAAAVDASHVAVRGDVRTGMAFVLVDAQGQNSIVVAPGANGRMTGVDVRAALQRLLAPPAVLVVQGEVPAESVIAAVEAAQQRGCRAILNLAPYLSLPGECLALCDPLVVNESEAGELLGREVADDNAADAAAELATRSRSAVITLGGAGAVLATPDGVERVGAEAAVVVDTTGAGDAFTGALAATLAQGGSMLDAVRIGVRAGTFAVGRYGAQASYPRRDDLR